MQRKYSLKPLRFGLLLRDKNLSSAPKTCRKWKNIQNQSNNIHSEVGIWQIWKVDDCQIQIYLKSDWHFKTCSCLRVYHHLIGIWILRDKFYNWQINHIEGILKTDTLPSSKLFQIWNSFHILLKTEFQLHVLTIS